MTAKQELLQVKLEFGHKASCRNRPTPEGFTHDWIVFVRGQEDKDISHFVEKVVFNLHESFHKPKRVIKDPPFKVEEHGYGSFSLPIDVYFKNKEQPKTVRIEYDLFLPAFGNPTIHNNRTEALKFLNPPEEFKKKVLKAGGEMLSSVNGSNGSPSSNQSSVNGNTGPRHGEISGKEIKETASTNEAEKIKKPKLEKQLKASNTGTKATLLTNKRPYDDDEVLPKVKKKKKKVEENPLVHSKSTGFIPIEPPASGEEEQHIIGNNKDVKLKIKSLPSSKSSKKSSKPQEKVVDKLQDKKKEKQNNSTDLNNSVVHSSNGDASKKKTVSSYSSSSKAKVKSPQECKPKITKPEERKVEKLMFRRESGDSWSSSTSSSSPSLPLFGNTIAAKNNALGTLMAELSDHDYDDEDEDIDISTPFQGDMCSVKVDSSLSNVLNKKYNKSLKAKAKSRDKKDTKKYQKETKKASHNSKNGGSSVKSPLNTSKAVESTKYSTKLNSKSKARNKNAKNGHQIPIPDLVDLHKELSSLKDRESLQRVVDILEKSGCFVITDTNLEFDLITLDMTTIRQIQKCVKR